MDSVVIPTPGKDVKLAKVNSIDIILEAKPILTNIDYKNLSCFTFI